MNENLDLTKILNGCPEGTEFYSTVYGEVRFVSIDIYDIGAIELKGYIKVTNSTDSIYYTKEGICSCGYDCECTLFPSKDQRDWSKFVRFWDKPKVEKFDPKTFHPFDKVLVRTNHNGFWSCDLYSHINIEYMANVVCVGDVWEMCIPYNDDTKHLVGTKEDCPEYYKWWEE